MSRRALVRAGAWSVPVATAIVAVPEFAAASTVAPPPVPPSLLTSSHGTAVRSHSAPDTGMTKKTVTVPITLTNTGGSTVALTVEVTGGVVESVGATGWTGGTTSATAGTQAGAGSTALSLVFHTKKAAADTFTVTFKDGATTLYHFDITI